MSVPTARKCKANREAPTTACPHHGLAPQPAWTPHCRQCRQLWRGDSSESRWGHSQGSQGQVRNPGASSNGSPPLPPDRSCNGSWSPLWQWPLGSESSCQHAGRSCRPHRGSCRMGYRSVRASWASWRCRGMRRSTARYLWNSCEGARMAGSVGRMPSWAEARAGPAFPEDVASCSFCTHRQLPLHGPTSFG